MKLFVLDGQDVPNSEDMAMLQALYSRSADSVTDHLRKVDQTGSGKFMASYYLGYGHSSIGECGETVLFFENVSILAAKALQNFTQYAGQECSTRYLDFSTRDLIDPLAEVSSTLTKIQQDWRTFYSKVQPKVASLLAEIHLREETVKEDVWQRAINARSFDICRCFLPIGATTQLSWKTNLRKARERLLELKLHPCKEVRDLAQSALSQLISKYPSSFKVTDADEHKTLPQEFREQYTDIYNGDVFDQDNDKLHGTFRAKWVPGCDSLPKNNKAADFMLSRPCNVEVPQSFSRFGGFDVRFKIDYGSFRDIQRHRSASIPMPLVNTFDFHPWYLEAIRDLSTDLYTECIQFIDSQFSLLKTCSEYFDKYEMQYYFPLGTMVNVNMYTSLPSAVYITELRTTQFVHPTLRTIAQQLAKTIQGTFQKIPLYVDYTPSLFAPGRGTQTITEKK
jgi:thymidylate synthase ThyX